MPDNIPATTSGSSAGRPFVGWLVVGVAGVGLWFVGSVHLPDTIKVPGLFPVILALVAGTGLGLLGSWMQLRPTFTVAVVAWLTITGGEVVSTVKTNRDRVAYLRTLREWQDISGTPIDEALRRAREEQPAAQTDEEKKRRQEMLEQMEFGEAYRKERLARLTFYGFLKERIPKPWGKWSYPWPAVLWGAEIVIGSTLGAWLTLSILRNASERERDTTT
ncbi:MAG TPA: hypothetical protein VGH74_13920, partial [Planctomycetaceae bacterium]